GELQEDSEAGGPSRRRGVHVAAHPRDDAPAGQHVAEDRVRAPGPPFDHDDDGPPQPRPAWGAAGGGGRAGRGAGRGKGGYLRLATKVATNRPGVGGSPAASYWLKATSGSDSVAGHGDVIPRSPPFVQ